MCLLAFSDAQNQLRPAELLLVASWTVNHRQAVTAAKLLNCDIASVKGGEKVGAVGRNDFAAFGAAARVRPRTDPDRQYIDAYHCEGDRMAGLVDCYRKSELRGPRRIRRRIVNEFQRSPLLKRLERLACTQQPADESARYLRIDTIEW